MDSIRQKKYIPHIKSSIRKVFILLFMLSAGTFGVLLYEKYQLYAQNKEVSPRMNRSVTAPVKLPTSFPVRLTIPSLAIDTSILPVGQTSTGAMANVQGFKNVGWYKYGPVPGELGSAVLAGHVDNSLAIDGVFKHLNEIKNNDDIYIHLENGKVLHFKVLETEVYPYDKAPKEIIFARNDHARLNIITCAGSWNKKLKTYDQRLVVFATLVS